MAWRSYATVEDLAAYLDADSMPDDPERMLRDSTIMIDRLLLSAQYEVDGPDDMPVDPRYVAAFRDAVCEQVNWWQQTGDPYGARAAFSNLSIGGLSAATAGPAGPRPGTRISPQAIVILENAGLLGQAPVTW